MKTKAAPHVCLNCNDPIRGRADKRFCNTYCRNYFHNSNRSTGEGEVRSVNSLLMRNRKILRGLLGETESVHVSKEKLIERGFAFSYLTQAVVRSRGVVFQFCYDVGYREMPGKKLMIVRRSGRQVE